MAPEVLKGAYSKNADLWSIGVIAYMLLSSQMPFYGRNRKQIIEQILRGYVMMELTCRVFVLDLLDAVVYVRFAPCPLTLVRFKNRTYEYKGRRWKRISKQGKAFIDDLLVVDPDDRATSDEAMKASWLNRRFGATVRSPHFEEIESVKNCIVKYADYSKLKKVALMGTFDLLLSPVCRVHVSLLTCLVFVRLKSLRTSRRLPRLVSSASFFNSTIQQVSDI
jgi:calcium-dependent protein kinase